MGPRAIQLRPWSKPPISSQLERVRLSRIRGESDGRLLGMRVGSLGFWSLEGIIWGGTRGLKVAILSAMESCALFVKQVEGHGGRQASLYAAG